MKVIILLISSSSSFSSFPLFSSSLLHVMLISSFRFSSHALDFGTKLEDVKLKHLGSAKEIKCNAGSSPSIFFHSSFRCHH